MTDELIRKSDALELFDDWWLYAPSGQQVTSDVCDAIAALPAVTVGVKALEWHQIDAHPVRWLGHQADASNPDYVVHLTADDPDVFAWGLDCEGWYGFCDTIDAAKAAAQADYTARILAALEPVEAPDEAAKNRHAYKVGVAVGKASAAPDPAAIREALKPLLNLVEEFVTATYHLLDNSETSGPVDDPTITVWQPDFDAVSALLDRCEGLPSGSTEHMAAGELLVANILALIPKVSAE